MKKGIKIFFIIFAILVVFVLVDTFQAKIFDNNPLLKTRDNLDGGNVDYVDRGIFVYTYVFTNGEKVTVYRWEKYSPPAEPQADLETNRNLQYEKLENVKFDYSLPDMVEDKCYIVLDPKELYHKEDLNGFIVYHLEELDNFIENVQNNKPAEIRIVEYTPDEQQPILTNLQYQNNKFIMQIDNTRDGAAPQEDKKIVTNEYDASEYILDKDAESDNSSNFELILKSKKSSNSIHICNYINVKKEDNPKFEIQFNENSTNITKILGKDETDKYNYDIYSYKGTVDIVINNEKMSLRDALINNKITIDEILENANKDINDGIIFGDFYLDGGSKYYLYEDFSILKLNTLDGNSDFYIGVPTMDINDLKK